MAFHTTHNEHYVLIEPEYDYIEIEDLDDIINQILGDFTEVCFVILFMGTLDYLSEEDLDQLFFLNDELIVKGGYLLVVTHSEKIAAVLKNKINISPTIDEAFDTIESQWLDKALFLGEN